MNRLLIPAILAGFSFPALAAEYKYAGLEPGRVALLYSEAGMNPLRCADDPKKCSVVAEVGRETKLELTGQITRHSAPNKFTGQQEPIEYIEVAVEGPDGKKTIGWIERDYLRDKPETPLYGPPAPPDCRSDPSPRPPPSVSPGNERQMLDLRGALNNGGVGGTATALSQIVGTCAWTTKSGPVKGGQNTFDAYVLPLMKKAPIPSGITNEKGEPLTREQLIEISALARTLYGEIETCYKRGLQYPMAVARVVMNREADADHDGTWINNAGGIHSSEKTRLTKILTTPSQFNAWNPAHGMISFRYAMCPPTDTNGAYWGGTNPPKDQLQSWEDSVRIATEAVLKPTSFKDRTRQVPYKYYTSYLGQGLDKKTGKPIFYGAAIARNAAVEGRPVNDPCVELRHEPPPPAALKKTPPKPPAK